MLDFEARVAEDGDVVAPRRRREVDLARVRVVAGEEGAGDPEGARARERLGDGNLYKRADPLSSGWPPVSTISQTSKTYAVLLERLRVLAVREHGGRVGELSKASDREVLLVAALADDLVLRLQRACTSSSANAVREREGRTSGLTARTEGRT